MIRYLSDFAPLNHKDSDLKLTRTHTHTHANKQTCTHKYTRIEKKREKMKKRLVQYAREYILYSHALVRANIFCNILKGQRKKKSNGSRSWK